MFQVSTRLLAARALPAIFFIVANSVSLAGPSASGRRGGGDNRRPASGTKPTPAVEAELDGSLSGFIQKFTPSKEGDDEKLMGYITFKPLDEKIKTFKVAVYKSEDVKIGLTDHSFVPEEAGDYLAKGLFCKVTWQPNHKSKDKSAARELKDLMLDTIDVEGTIDSHSEELIVIKGRPIEGDWPGMDSTANARPGKPMMVPQKKLKLKVIQDVTKYTDSSDQEIDVGDFADDTINATIVFGKSQGFIVAIRPQGPRRASAIAPQTGRNAPPPPREKGGGKAVGGG